jgi:hypothetical protein
VTSRIVGGPAAWRGAELAATDDWTVRLTDGHVAELRAALAQVRGRGLPTERVTRADFPLPSLGPVLDGCVRTLVAGRGFVLLRGVPVSSLATGDIRTLYWGIGQHVGVPIPQNPAGETLVRVTDQGLDYRDPTVRGYQTRAQLDYHADSSDVVGLLCLHPAKRGGLSTIVSSVAIHDEIVRRRPDLAAVLYGPFYFDRRRPSEEESFYASPVFSFYGGRLSTRYGRSYIESAQRGSRVPRLTGVQVEAMDLFDALARSPELSMAMRFQPGDIQLLNNWVILHARTAYEDHPEPDRKRELLRLWLTLRVEWPLAPEFSGGGITPRRAAFR